ncbi:Hsp20/alpha crystallin family protein [Nesterenkonia sp. E16_7]|uniref:Hsp20/alpha crystallin family protein n=1 Tax=unclassified Nesterenkonia TaxID=2629769 RepID=UPI001A92D876|nr:MULTISPECIES: Hsp20/alpha crystallin family protein [unclassified Nesterenkonia]MBO0595932.1 Hsp20/alpha crystallin family protein [Nesterenkonia sp. E16_10]MBO0599468.1 Hsp20/alpha crystallin family protein [Nesterenkonia sp. E16_7]
MTHTLVRFDPFAGFESLRRELFDDGPLRGRLGKLPTTDVYTNDNRELVIEAHLPNFEEENVTVNLGQGALVIQAERHEHDEDKKKKYVIRESSSSFYRSIDLPEQAETERINASFDDGVLKVTVPLKELSVPTRIPITGGHNGESAPEES